MELTQLLLLGIEIIFFGFVLGWVPILIATAIKNIINIFKKI